jgi:hypothetical protein
MYGLLEPGRQSDGDERERGEGRKEGRKVGIWESKVIVGEARRRRNKEEEEKEEDDEEQVGAPTVPSAVIRGSN